MRVYHLMECISRGSEKFIKKVKKVCTVANKDFFYIPKRSAFWRYAHHDPILKNGFKRSFRRCGVSGHTDRYRVLLREEEGSDKRDG